MTKLQTEAQEMLARAHAEADRGHMETVQRHEEIMMLIKKPSRREAIEDLSN